MAAHVVQPLEKPLNGNGIIVGSHGVVNVKDKRPDAHFGKYLRSNVQYALVSTGWCEQHRQVSCGSICNQLFYIILYFRRKINIYLCICHSILRGNRKVLQLKKQKRQIYLFCNKYSIAINRAIGGYTI